MPTIKTYRKVGAFYIAWEEEWLLKILRCNSENIRKIRRQEALQTIYLNLL